ncbi:hypothetical protein D3C85_1046200 [compost metagenome]
MQLDEGEVMFIFDPLDDHIVMTPCRREPGHGGVIAPGETAPEELLIDPDAIEQG